MGWMSSAVGGKRGEWLGLECYFVWFFVLILSHGWDGWLYNYHQSCLHHSWDREKGLAFRSLDTSRPEREETGFSIQCIHQMHGFQFPEFSGMTKLAGNFWNLTSTHPEYDENQANCLRYYKPKPDKESLWTVPGNKWVTIIILLQMRVLTSIFTTVLPHGPIIASEVTPPGRKIKLILQSNTVLSRIAIITIPKPIWFTRST